MTSRPPKAVHLLYGNQPYLIEQRARQLVDAVLGPGERDFTYHRFDAEEMLRQAPADVLAANIDALQVAIQSLPLLGDRYLVRLDHVERVRPPSRAAQNLQKRLAELELHAVSWEGVQAWILPEHLLAGEEGGERTNAQRWIAEVSARADGGSAIALADGWEDAQFLMAGGEARRAMGIKPFLRAVLKGSFTFADEEGEGRSAPPAAGTARLHELLARTVERPPPGCHVLLTATAAREGDLSRALVNEVKRHGAIEKFVTYDDYVPLDWVLQEGRARGLNLAPDAAELLVRMLGNDHGRLAQELEKLSLLFPSGSAVGAEMLMGALHAGHHGSLFLINDKLCARDLSGALDVLEQFLEQRPHEYPVLIGVLARHFRQLCQIHAYSRQGTSDADLATRLKVHPFIAKRLAGQASRFSPRELERIVQALAMLDRTTRLHAHVAAVLFRDLVVAVCRGDYEQRAPHFAIGQL